MQHPQTGKTFDGENEPSSYYLKVAGTIAQQFAADRRVVEAKQQLLDTLRDYQQQLTEVSPPKAVLAQSYHAAIEHFEQMRGSELYYPYLASGIGNGSLVELADASVKYDMIGGIGVHVTGHSHRDMAEATLSAALSDTVMQGNLQQNVEAAELCNIMLQLANSGGAHLHHCFLTTSGAMANENALKMVFHKRQPAHRLLAFAHCFMGRTLALAHVTDKPAYREGLPLTLDVDYVPFFDPESPRASTDLAVATLNHHLDSYPDQHAAMCFEMVQGEGGYYPGSHGFFAALMDVLKQKGIAVMVDEVQTFGRTTRPFAYSHFQLNSYVDVVTVGKMTQVCATLFTDEYTPGRGLISQTFTASTSAILAAKVILGRLTEGDYFGPDGRIAKIHERFVHHLQTIADRHPTAVKGPFGIGGMISFTAYDGSSEKAKHLLMHLYDAGVIAFVAGSDPARIRMLPPVLAITDHDIDEVCKILASVIAHAEA